MAEKIAAGEGALERGAVAVDDAKAGIKAYINDIEAKMGELRSYWSGDAANAYATLMSNWQAKANDINNILDTLSANLRGTAKVQAANEEENQSLTSNLQSLLG